ncbi:hypothetical protein [Dysosmobacter sp.]
MLLTRQQKYILEIMQKLGAVRIEQLTRMLQMRFFPEGHQVPDGFTERLVRQLIYCGEHLQLQGDVLSLLGKRANEHRLEAVDVMLELSQRNLSDFWAQDDGLLLRFAVSGRRVSIFAVIHSAALTDAEIRAPPTVGPTERVVILLQGANERPQLPIPNPKFYALRQADGTHRFFTEAET